VIEFISIIPFLAGLLDLSLKFTGDCPGGVQSGEGWSDPHPALRRRAVHSVLKWAKVMDLAFQLLIIFHNL